MTCIIWSILISLRVKQCVGGCLLPGAADLMCFPSLASPETQTGTGTVTGTDQTEIVTVTVVATVPAKRAAAVAVAVGGAVRIIYLLGMVSCPLLVVLG